MAMESIYDEYIFRLQAVREEMEEGYTLREFITRAIALVPMVFLEYLDEKGMLFMEGQEGRQIPVACICINYYSQSTPGERFDIIVGGEPLRTFCLRPKEEEGENIFDDGDYDETEESFYDRLGKVYDREDIFVKLMDCYFRSRAMAPGELSVEDYLRDASARRKYLPEFFVIDENGFHGRAYDYLDRSEFALGPGWSHRSFANFLDAASCVMPSFPEPVYEKWGKTWAAQWAERHKGRTFSLFDIPVRDVVGNVIADIMIPNLLPPARVEAMMYDILRTFAKEASHCVREIWEYENAENSRALAVRLAATSVMARNLSHNFGSHVLGSLLSPKRETFLSDSEQSPFRGIGGVDRKEAPASVQKDDPGLDPFLQVSYLNAYLRGRMDYISDFAYRKPATLLTRNVRSDIMAHFARTRLMLDHVSGLGKNFPYGIEVVNRVAKVDEQKYEGKPAEKLEIARRDAVGSDLSVAVPNDVIGTHALYNILENFIRNMAKHWNDMGMNGSGPADGVVHVVLEFMEPSQSDVPPDMYEVLLYGTRPYPKDDAATLVREMNVRIGSDLLVGQELRAENLGVIEMKAAAAVLRMEDICSLSPDSPVEPPLLEAVPVPGGKEGESYWGYRFYMLRPRDVFFVIQDETASDWNAMTMGTLKEFLAGGGVISHDFLVYDDDLKNEVEKLRERFRTALPVRMLGRGDLPEGSKPNRKACWIGWACLHESSWGTRSIKGDLSGTDTLASPSETAVILSHNEDGQGQPLDLGKVVDSWCGKEDHIYLEALSWEGKAILPRFQKVRNMTEYTGNLKDNRWRPVLAELLEAINTRIFVLDEQIQDAAYGQNYMGASLTGLLELSGVRVPDLSKYNLKELNLDHDALLSLIGEEVVKNDFVVLHYGLLERIFKSLENPKDDWLTLMRGKMNEWLSLDGAGEIVVTSGRGVPKNLPDEVRFLSRSALSTAITEVRSKSLLTRLLNASRRARLQGTEAPFRVELLYSPYVF